MILILRNNFISYRFFLRTGNCEFVSLEQHTKEVFGTYCNLVLLMLYSFITPAAMAEHQQRWGLVLLFSANFQDSTFSVTITLTNPNPNPHGK